MTPENIVFFLAGIVVFPVLILICKIVVALYARDAKKHGATNASC